MEMMVLGLFYTETAVFKKYPKLNLAHVDVKLSLYHCPQFRGL